MGWDKVEENGKQFGDEKTKNGEAGKADADGERKVEELREKLAQENKEKARWMERAGCQS